MKQKEIFMMYIINNRDKLQEDVRQLQQRVRYRNPDAVDCLELSLALERLNSFEEFARQSMAIFRMSLPDPSSPITYVSINPDYARDRIELERNKGK